MKMIAQIVSLLALIFVAGLPCVYAFEFKGFADVSFTKSTKDADAHRNGDFAFGSLDLYVAEVVEDVEILIETLIEEGDELDIERLTIGYTFNDAAKLRMGRFHTPLGFWNTAYHHGVQLQPTIERPKFLTFDDAGGILPTHVVGVNLLGRVNTRAGAVDYSAMLGNGPMIDLGKAVLTPNNTSDNNIGKSAAFNVSISPSVIAGLKLGVSGHIAEVTSNDDPVTIDVDQTIYALSAVYTKGPLGMAAEYFRIEDKSKSAGDFTNTAYYGLIKYSIKEKWEPYLMYEKLSVGDDDPYMSVLQAGIDNKEMTLGLRYNISYRSSLKGEYRNIIDEGGKDWDEVALQWALAF